MSIFSSSRAHEQAQSCRERASATGRQLGTVRSEY
jgi:hypothetical protein